MADALTQNRSPGSAARPSAGPAEGPLTRLTRIRELSVVLVTIAAVIYFSLTSGPGFNTPDNYHTIAQYLAPWTTVAAGEVMLLICGEIDLSAGFVFMLAPFVMVLFVNNYTPVLVAFIATLVVCALIGAANGLIHTRLNIPSFITTLGMAFLLWGLALIISNGSPVPAPNGGWVTAVFGGWPWSELLWSLVVVAVMQALLSVTRFGIFTKAVGGNRIAAAEAGIHTDRVKVTAFAMASTLAGFAGMLQGIRVGSFDPTNGGFDTMLYAVASAVIGGTALLGGSGTVIGALFGALLLSVVQDGFNLTGISANGFYVVLGLAILIAMALNVSMARLRGRLNRRNT